MVTPNKFSNPDVDACECPRFYVNCLITGPLQAIFCLPCVCCARAHKDHEKQRQEQRRIDGTPQTKQPGKGKEPQATIGDQPFQQPDMTTLPDASKPRDQWPAEWTDGHPEQAWKGLKRDEATAAEMGGTGGKTMKDKFADGVLKATAPI
ncbi:hypothetical protein F5X98DRAFT_84024 [Xylaria grammica]|nr:hypothetical protein F5X98DRAFT_84024 [Xylaria grammica]